MNSFSNIVIMEVQAHVQKKKKINISGRFGLYNFSFKINIHVNSVTRQLFSYHENSVGNGVCMA